MLDMVRVVAKLERGGAQLSLLRISAALRSRGVRTRLLCGWADPEGMALAAEYGFRPEVFGECGNLQWRVERRFADWLRPRLRDARLVHAHMFGAWWAAGQALDGDVPLLASEHNPYAWPALPQLEAMREGLRRVDRFYAHGPGARDSVLAAGLPAARMREGVSPIVGMDAVPVPALPRPRLVFAGRLHEEKGPDVLLEALALAPTLPHLLMLGAGHLEASLRERSERPDLRHRVTFCGWQQDPGAFMAGATALVVPSRDEAWSQTAVLGMALGVPVVGTDVEGFALTLSAGRGIAVPPADAAALARALLEVTAGQRGTDLAGARAWARGFELGRLAGVYEADYRQLAGAPSVTEATG